MIIFPGKLSDFTTEKSFIAYKQKFIGQCVRVNHPITDDIILSTNAITYNNQSFENGDDYEEYKFNVDYLIQSIRKMVINWERKFISKAKTLYTIDDKSGFRKEVLNTFRVALKKIKSAVYLSPGQRIHLVKEINLFEAFITSYIDDPLPEIKKKIEFNWDKNTLVFFFILLRKNGIINEIRDTDLGGIIDDRFLYKDADGYEIPKESRKLLYALGDKGTKSSENSYHKLKETFMNSDFYNG